MRIIYLLLFAVFMTVKLCTDRNERECFNIGGVAQLGERLPCKQEVIGSIPFTSTKLL